jgi:hypothetical protein
MPVPNRTTVRYLMPALRFGIILIPDDIVDLNMVADMHERRIWQYGLPGLPI